MPRSIVAGRSSNLPAVPSAPITRNIVIRGTPSTASPADTPIQEFVPPALRQGPAASRWRCRPRANRCQKVGLRLRATGACTCAPGEKPTGAE